MAAKPKRFEITRDYDYRLGVAQLRFGGKPFMKLGIDELDEKTARTMCLQQLVAAVTGPAQEKLRLGKSKDEVVAEAVETYSRIMAGGYKARGGKATPGNRKHGTRIKQTAHAVYAAGYRTLNHGGRVWEFHDKDTAETAFRWLWKAPADPEGTTGRARYFQIMKIPEVQAYLDNPSPTGRQALS